jgi:hypothetical protein
MSTLIDELRQPLYAAMTDAEAAAELGAANKIEIFSRFGSFRTLANRLTEAEYNVLAAVLDNTAVHSRLVADMVKMLDLPGDEAGNGGGIDLGSAAVRTKIDALQPDLAAVLGGDNAAGGAAALCAKVSAYAERTTSTAAMLGLGNVTENDVHNARAEM